MGKHTEPDRVLVLGRADYDRCDNEVISARYNAFSFFPKVSFLQVIIVEKTWIQRTFQSFDTWNFDFSVVKGSDLTLLLILLVLIPFLLLKAILEQFRRFANQYFLAVGLIMFVGRYTNLYESAISPWTTLGPLAIVISISLLVEGISDYKRHLNDVEMNNAKCVVLQRSSELDDKVKRDDKICGGREVEVNINKAFYLGNAGSSVRGMRQRTVTDPNDPHADIVRVAYTKVKRKDIRQGQFVFVKNREMVPADMLLLASSNDQGGAYIETSSIDGETNLKLRSSPHIPKKLLKALQDGKPMERIREEGGLLDSPVEEQKLETVFESLDAATKRMTRLSALGRPGAASALEHPSLKDSTTEVRDEAGSSGKSWDCLKLFGKTTHVPPPRPQDRGKYVAALTTEPPNASVHTFSGKLTLPPFEEPSHQESSCYEIPLGADNVLLRGAVLRNTEWAIGLAFFTGKDTKLVRNSTATPSKFSQLDRLMNKTVLCVLLIMVCCISFLAAAGVHQNNDKFDTLFYAGYNTNTNETWPYFKDTELANEEIAWDDTPYNFVQFFFLFVTLVSNLIPLSLYVTVEVVQFALLWLVYVDVEMYDDATDTRALARSTIVSDLGRIQYIFSDKTGTLTQNVMRFKRCSVDAMAFGAPIERQRPRDDKIDGEEERATFHPLRQLLVGRVERPVEPGLEELGSSTSLEAKNSNGLDGMLTFHSEMFLRIMSLCHTVVVEKDIENKKQISSGVSFSSTTSSKSIKSFSRGLFGGNRRRNDTDSSNGAGPQLASLGEEVELGDYDSGTFTPLGSNRGRTASASSLAPGEDKSTAKNSDGAPAGYAYQAESPDEGALVSAASTTYGFQLVGRDSSGIRLRCPFRSHFQDARVVDGLKSQNLTLQRLAAETSIDLEPTTEEQAAHCFDHPESVPLTELREETWAILAINKFDSDRKRMSILLRAPPDLGSLAILFCKGADAAMLDPEVCGDNAALDGDRGLGESLSALREYADENEEDPEGSQNTMEEVGYGLAHILGIQMHLGEFAREGLRTLVLGMRLLTEKECTEWLDTYKTAAVSLSNREALLSEAARKIEKGLHIIGATAIEDKLQKNVPRTISTLEKAGIKLWVLTGDKRETAVEIGYSTHVLTSKMHLTEVPDHGKEHVRTQLAMEFIRLIKRGKLPAYQKAALEAARARTFKERMGRRLSDIFFRIGKAWRKFRRNRIRVMAKVWKVLGLKSFAAARLDKAANLKYVEQKRIKGRIRRKIVREKAEQTIKDWVKQRQKFEARSGLTIKKHDGERSSEEDLELASEELPEVFNRAQTARSLYKGIVDSGRLSKVQMRNLSLAHRTAHEVEDASHMGRRSLVDEDTLSLDSFIPELAGIHEFDKKKRTILERMFAVDRKVRKGKLIKHMTKERREQISKQEKYEDLVAASALSPQKSSDGPRALVIEGAALKHLLGDHEFEEILFAVASHCDAVIACRVSPQQKALLVSLVRQNVRPEPVTLAIGDGANDVGMIQEAHVGVGISGREGKQAVNASDFSIAQFRFLETLVLIHGRWDFFRLSVVVLFSFYKNAVMAGTIMVYASRTVFSGTPLYDEWVVSMLNFVAGFPIVFLGCFDRCLSKDYVRKHPEVYNATRENELITYRTLLRWVLICTAHVMILYFFTVPQQSYAGGITPAFEGLSRNIGAPGDGEGSSLDCVGTVTYSCLIIILALKVRKLRVFGCRGFFFSHLY